MTVRVLLAICVAAVLSNARPASAQVLGTFRWRLAPYCNQLSLRIEQKGPIFEVSGTDDQCGGAVKAAANGSAHLNPNGTVGISVVVIRPDGIPIATTASISLSTLSGTWSDEYGNAGDFTFNPTASPGLPRRVTLTGVYAVIFTAAASPSNADAATITFGRRVPGVLSAGVVLMGQPSTAECAGTIDAPQAAPGKLCLYEGNSQNVAGILVRDGSGSASPNVADNGGALVIVFATAPGLTGSVGRWAVTLP